MVCPCARGLSAVAILIFRSCSLISHLHVVPLHCSEKPFVPPRVLARPASRPTPTRPESWPVGRYSAVPGRPGRVHGRGRSLRDLVEQGQAEAPRPIS
ncbi:MAG: hypothetical protein OZSIB_3615 [Candidatus Ozemobacter sibiricus]|uniref:Uncharacterized protein n=1 Tax=Candidatus Ozemobacter sibiricus TaxID=2268124 RepID=A0A367ZRZ0_9BACT|nr:MAG: hypothetical protein OZSIB_3615 [Candidatus Ozemobacter sibiricus]